MGLFLRDDNGRSRLQTKVQSDLNERLKDTKPLDIDTPEVDPRFLDNSHQTRVAGVIISVLLIILVIAALIWALKVADVF